MCSPATSASTSPSMDHVQLCTAIWLGPAWFSNIGELSIHDSPESRDFESFLDSWIHSFSNKISSFWWIVNSSENAGNRDFESILDSLNRAGPKSGSKINKMENELFSQCTKNFTIPNCDQLMLWAFRDSQISNFVSFIDYFHEYLTTFWKAFSPAHKHLFVFCYSSFFFSCFDHLAVTRWFFINEHKMSF